jgi:Uncharacterized protein conserved in bacteria
MSLIDLQAELTELTAPLGVEIVSLSWTKFNGNKVLELLINHPDGVDVDLCATVSETVVETVDRYMIEEENFYLEVASVGAEMPIKTLEEMQQALGAWIYVELHDAIQGAHTYEGELLSLDEEEEIILAYKDKTRTKEMKTNFANIKMARYAVKL